MMVEDVPSGVPKSSEDWAQSVVENISTTEESGLPGGTEGEELPISESVVDDNAEVAVDEALAVEEESIPVDSEELEKVRLERDQYLDASRRLQAEFENYRKQVSKREADARVRANESLVSEILPILDACDGAISNGASDVEPIQGSLLEALTKQGLEKVNPVGEPFDPEAHEAVMHSESDGSQGPVVSEVLRAGYLWKGKVLRAAMVSVTG